MCVAGQGLVRWILVALSTMMLCMRQLRLSREPQRTTVASDRCSLEARAACRPKLPATSAPDRPGLPTSGTHLALRRSSGAPSAIVMGMPSRQRFVMGMPIFLRNPLAIANRRARTCELPTLRRLPANPESLGRCAAAIASVTPVRRKRTAPTCQQISTGNCRVGTISTADLQVPTESMIAPT